MRFKGQLRMRTTELPGPQRLTDRSATRPPTPSNACDIRLRRRRPRRRHRRSARPARDRGSRCGARTSSRQQQASVTGRTVEEAVLLVVVGPMLRAHRIVRAQLPELDGLPQVPIDPIGRLHQPAERAFGVRARGVEQDAVAGLAGIDPFANGARRVAAVERHRGDQQVRQRVQHDERGAGNLARSPRSPSSRHRSPRPAGRRVSSPPAARTRPSPLPPSAR